jgi:hypothetical protein
MGTAATDARVRVIWVKPKVFQRPNLRHRHYVLPHEVWHALNAETGWLGVMELAQQRSLTLAGAREAIADGGVLDDTPSALMRSWVRASILWHRRLHAMYSYTLADCTSPESRAIRALLREKVAAP